MNKETGAVANQNKIVFHEYQSRVGVGSDFFKLNFAAGAKNRNESCLG